MRAQIMSTAARAWTTMTAGESEKSEWLMKSPSRATTMSNNETSETAFSMRSSLLSGVGSGEWRVGSGKPKTRGVRRAALIPLPFPAPASALVPFTRVATRA